MSQKSKLSPKSKAVLEWSGVTLEELAEHLALSTDETQRLLDDPTERAHLVSSINSTRQVKVWEVTSNRLDDLLCNLPEKFNSNYRAQLDEMSEYITCVLSGLKG